MDILIVESDRRLATDLAPLLERKGAIIAQAASQNEAASFLVSFSFNVIIIDIQFDNCKALGIAELADFRQPDAKVIFVSDSSIFSDGSLYHQFSNVCGYLPRGTPPKDIASLVEYYARRPAQTATAPAPRQVAYEF